MLEYWYIERGLLPAPIKDILPTFIFARKRKEFKRQVWAIIGCNLQVFSSDEGNR